MNALRLRIKLFGKKTEFEKDLVRLACHEDLVLPPNKLFTRKNTLQKSPLISPLALLEGMKESETNENAKHNIKLFLDNLQTLNRWEDIVKFLIVAHQAIYDEMSAFIHQFAAIDMENICTLPDDKQEFKLYARCGLVKYYYRYLKKLADSFYSLKKCRKYTPSDYQDLLKNNDTQLIFQHKQLNELIVFVSKVEDFYVSSAGISEIPIMQLIGEMMLRDCIEMYNLLATFVSKSIGMVFQLPEDLALSLDEVYSDVIRLKKPVESFYETKGLFLGLVAFVEPNYYHLDKDFNRKEELYVNAIRKSRKTQGFAHSQSLIILPDKASNYFSIDDDDQEHHMTEVASKNDVRIDLGAHSKSVILEKKYNSDKDNETLLTHEEKDYSEFTNDHKGKKKMDSGISLSSMLSSKQSGISPTKAGAFTKVQSIDLEHQ